MSHQIHHISVSHYKQLTVNPNVSLHVQCSIECHIMSCTIHFTVIPTVLHHVTSQCSAVGDFTFRLSPWLSLLAEPKNQVQPEMRQKVKSNFSFGLSHGSVWTFASAWDGM